MECVNWYDAVEFCNRLSKLTEREYTLPSEAKWEYSCRAGTTTPFNCGETITTDLANYDGNYTYGNEPKGQYKKETTPVGSFPANDWGLSDMHDNVWEWCADEWHDNYNNAPTDGNVWTGEGYSNRYVMRGGSWDDDPNLCCCASRDYDDRDDYAYDLDGFRVMSIFGRTSYPFVLCPSCPLSCISFFLVFFVVRSCLKSVDFL